MCASLSIALTSQRFSGGAGAENLLAGLKDQSRKANNQT